MKKKPIDLSIIPTFSNEVLKDNYRRFKENVQLWCLTGAEHTANKALKTLCDNEKTILMALEDEMKKRNLHQGIYYERKK